MEVGEEGIFENIDLGFTSVSVDVSDVGTIDVELKNLAIKDDDDDTIASYSVSNSVSKEENNKRRFHYPIRPNEPDCTFYMRTGTCRYGSNCRFNHPPRRRNQVGKEREREKEKENEEKENEEENENEEFSERDGQQECKYYLKSGGCKFGKACRYNHSREKSGAGEPVDLNFLGLPIRPGERECPFYMRTGSCKFATSCRFHHPDPTAVGGCDPLPVYQNDSSLPLHALAASSSLPTGWPLQRTSNEPVPYMEASRPPYLPVMLSPPQGVPPNPEWNGYMGQTSPLFPPERYMQAPSASAMNDLTKKPDNSTYQLQTTVEEFPERPGQPECQFFMKNGDCKFRSACRYHHPKNRVSKLPACALSPMGLPLRPDQNICTHYSRYGICKFGPACKYDHPINSGPSATPATPASDQPPSLEKSIFKEARVPTFENGTDALN